MYVVAYLISILDVFPHFVPPKIHAALLLSDCFVPAPVQCRNGCPVLHHKASLVQTRLQARWPLGHIIQRPGTAAAPWRQMHPPNLGNGIPWDLFPPPVHRSQVINICWIKRTPLHFSLPAMPTWSNFCIFIVSICDEHIAPPFMVRCTNPTTCTLTPNHNLHSPGKKGNGGCLSPFPLKWGF